MGRLPRSLFGKLAFTLAFTLSTLTLGLGADAGVQWCESDPVFLVNGALVDVTTGFPASYTDTLKGAVAYEVLCRRHHRRRVTRAVARATLSDPLPLGENGSADDEL